MWRLFQILFIGHYHEWETVDKGTIIDDNNFKCGHWYILRCKHCGTIKKKSLLT